MRNIILILFLLTLVSNNKFLKREALPEELDNGIILQKESPSSSRPRANINHAIFKPINPTKPIIAPNIKNRPKNYGNHIQKNQGINIRPKKYANQGIPIIKPYGPKINVRPIRPPCQDFKCEQKNHDKNNRSQKPSPKYIRKLPPLFIRTTRPPNPGFSTKRHYPKL